MCEARYEALQNPIHYPSNSNPHGKGYSVYLYRTEKSGKIQPDMCTCRPFLNGRSKAAKAAGIPADQAFFECTHIKDAKAKICDWTENDSDKRYHGFQFGNECPKCKGPIHTDAAPTPVPGAKPTAPSTESMEDVRKLAAELRGVPYVPLAGVDATGRKETLLRIESSLKLLRHELDQLELLVEELRG